jgi:hypothetical protein
MNSQDVKNAVEVVKLVSDIVGSWVDRRRKQKEKEEEREQRLASLEAEIALLRAERQQPAPLVHAHPPERSDSE